MSFRKGPAIIGVLIAVVAVGVVLLVSGNEESDAPTGEGTQSAQETSPQGGGSEDSSAGSQSGGQGEGGDSGSDAPAEPVIEVENGEVVGGTQELSFAPGDQIRFAVASDAADEIHFHGYDLYADIPAGGEAQIETEATLEGVFEVELHESGAEVAEVTVAP